MAVVVGAEQPGEAGRGVEVRQAEPVHRAVGADQRRRAAVADQRVVLDRQRHSTDSRVGGVEPPARVHGLLQDRGQTVATAESLTGGRLAAALTGVPGASQSYVGGVVAYATSVKEDVLGVPPPGRAVRRDLGRVRAGHGPGGRRGHRGDLGDRYDGRGRPGRQDGHPPGTVHVGLVGPGVSTALALELVAAGRRSRSAPARKRCRRWRACFPLERTEADEPREEDGSGSVAKERGKGDAHGPVPPTAR